MKRLIFWQLGLCLQPDVYQTFSIPSLLQWCADGAGESRGDANQGWGALEDLMGEDGAEGEGEASQCRGWADSRQGWSHGSSGSSTQRCACPRNLVQERSAELINTAGSHLTLLESTQGKHCLKMPKVCRRNSKGPRMGRKTLGSTPRGPGDPSLCSILRCKQHMHWE